MKVLYIEDDLSFAKLYKKVIKKAEPVSDVHHFTSIKDAKEAMQRDKYDLCVLDMMLPDSDEIKSIAFAKALKIPVIMLTVRNEDFLKKQFEKKDSVYYFVKSEITPEAFVRGIEIVASKA